MHHTQPQANADLLIFSPHNENGGITLELLAQMANNSNNETNFPRHSVAVHAPLDHNYSETG